MKLEVAAPTRIADLVVELATAGALRISTHADDVDGARLAATTVIHLDGDVTTSITPTCFEPERDGARALLQRHTEEIGKLRALFQRGTERAVRLIAWLTLGLTVSGGTLDAAVGHSWRHIAVTLAGLTGAGGVAVGLVRRVSLQLLTRGVRHAIAKHRAAATAAAG
jgi:hypothetical protein